MRLRLIILAAVTVLVASLGSANRIVHAQSDIQGPINALHLEKDRLLIGQGTQLIDTQVTTSDLTINRVVDLKHHDIRAITISQGLTLVLTEDGLISLNPQDQILDFIQGGGQRLTVSAQRVYVAALAAGVRVLTIDPAGKFTLLGALATRTPALDVAPQDDHLLWVAEGDRGVDLYDANNLTARKSQQWLLEYTPATAVRVDGTRLYIGHGNQLSILDTTIKRAGLINTIKLDDTNASISDLAIHHNTAYIGRTGGDALAVNLANNPLQSISMGQNTASDVISAYEPDVFIGSSQEGLRRLRFDANRPALIKAWTVTNASDTCTLSTLTALQPLHLSAVAARPITLSWQADCAVKYELHIDDSAMITLDTPAYTLQAHIGLTTWQVTAIDAAGNRLVGPNWTFEMLANGWLATPTPISPAAMLYKPPAITFDLHSPQGILLATCAAVGLGLLLIGAVAWLIGLRAQRHIL